MSRRRRLLVGLRRMSRRDWPQVLAIERASFDWPMDERDLRRELNHLQTHGFVAEDGRGVQGFALFAAYPQGVKLLDLAVAEKTRRRTVGSQMVAWLAGEVRRGDRLRIVLDIRETNLAGQLFFRSAGFRAVRVLRDHYRDFVAEDAYRMVWESEPENRPLPANRISRLLEGRGGME